MSINIKRQEIQADQFEIFNRKSQTTTTNSRISKNAVQALKISQTPGEVT